jgi:hypothetical protein
MSAKYCVYDNLNKIVISKHRTIETARKSLLKCSRHPHYKIYYNFTKDEMKFSVYDTLNNLVVSGHETLEKAEKALDEYTHCDYNIMRIENGDFVELSQT